MTAVPVASPPLYAFDAAWVLERRAPLAGADEAGRGALAGPLVAAAVVLGDDEISGINDSKALGRGMRERIFGEVLSDARAVSVVAFAAWWIDRHGLGRANREALTRALRLLDPLAGCGLADGNLALGAGVECLPKADAKSAAVAAASIVAKVLRDGAMGTIARDHAGYGFERNAGYGTAEHRLALAELGPCRVHRLSYAGVGAWAGVPPPRRRADAVYAALQSEGAPLKRWQYGALLCALERGEYEDLKPEEIAYGIMNFRWETGVVEVGPDVVLGNWSEPEELQALPEQTAFGTAHDGFQGNEEADASGPETTAAANEALDRLRHAGRVRHELVVGEVTGPEETIDGLARVGTEEPPEIPPLTNSQKVLIVRLVLAWDGENDASRVADACAAGNESVTPEEVAEKVRNLWPEDPPCPPLEAVSASVEGLLLGDERGVAVSGGRASWRQTRGRGAFG